MNTKFSRRAFLASSLALSACSTKSARQSAQEEIFICPPCGCASDQVEFTQPGTCPDCGMTLGPRDEIELGHQPVELPTRAGAFTLPGGNGHHDDLIYLHYYKPEGFTPDSKILLIIPGAGRNSTEYRNAWLSAARQNNVFVVALGYPEKDYDFAAYHLAGMAKNMTFRKPPSETLTQGTRVVRINDEDLQFEINPKKEEWLFNDFDRVFDYVAGLTGSRQQTYDIFGHSAGGQILHRMTLLQTKTRANKIIAANSGFYTLPDLTRPLPTGLKGLDSSSIDFEKALNRNLTLLLGELDNGDTAGGTMLHTPKVDEQGGGRLARGNYFYAKGLAKSKHLGVPFGWSLKTVPGVNHNFELMSQEAARLLYF